jgi:peptide/nickel transport system permease protein
MALYILNRVLSIFLVLLAVSFIIFFVTHVLPGSAASLMLGEYATPESLKILEREMGLDKPFYIQYLNWVEGIISGHWGDSLVMKQPVASIIKLRVKNSAFLAIFSLSAVILIGIPLGILAALRQKGKLDLAIMTGSYIGISIPDFVTGILLILFFAGPWIQLLPTGGYQEFSSGASAWLKHLILPSATLTLILLAHVVRQTRSGVIEVLRSNYIRTARLKGAPERRVILRHTLRNGLLPTITVLAMDLGYLMGSIVIVEEVFAYPGMGRLIIYAITNRDIPLLQMAVLIIAAIYTVSNFAADMLYMYLDPRIRYR